MKVALISIHPFTEEGGVKTHILNLYEEFKRKGAETKILVPRAKIFEKYKLEDIVLLGTSLKIEFGAGISDLIFNFTPFSIERVLFREKFEILHFHNFSFPGSPQILLSPLSFSTKNILTFHSNVERSKFLTKYPFFIDLLNYFCNLRIHGLILVSKVLLKFFEKYKGPIKIIPNGISLEKFNPKIPPLKKFSDSMFNILFVGRIEERKGLLYLLRAFKILKRKYKNLRLIVVGDGPDKKISEDFVKRERLKDVFFEGEISVEKVPFYYASCDIFCAPSIFGESFGIILLEAMACQKPVVCFDIDAFLEVTKGGKGVLLAKNKNFFDLAKKIEVLILNKNLRKKLAIEGRNLAKEYSWEKIAKEVLSFYQEVKKYQKKFF